MVVLSAGSVIQLAAIPLIVGIPSATGAGVVASSEGDVIVTDTAAHGVALTDSLGPATGTKTIPDLATWTDDYAGVWVNHGAMTISHVGAIGDVSMSDTTSGLVLVTS